MKRIFDITFSAFFLIILFIPIMIISILIKALTPGRVIYWSERVGIKNKLFLMPKFRTMRENTPELATDKLKNPNKYITKFGKFLRKTSLDELPQFVNVLKGEMSIVGPRPLFDEDTKLFDKSYMRRLNVLPGITGLLQINERNTSEFSTWYKYDIEYIENWSLFLDLKILLKTPFSMVNSKTRGR